MEMIRGRKGLQSRWRAAVIWCLLPCPALHSDLILAGLDRQLGPRDTASCTWRISMMSAGLMARNQKYPKRFPLFLLQFLDSLRAMIAKHRVPFSPSRFFYSNTSIEMAPLFSRFFPGVCIFGNAKSATVDERKSATLQSKMNLTGLDIFQRAECRLPSLSCASAHFSADLSRRSSRHTPHPPPNANLRLCPELSCACADAGWAGLCTAFLMANHLTLLLTDCVETSVNFCWFAEYR